MKTFNNDKKTYPPYEELIKDLKEGYKKLETDLNNSDFFRENNITIEFDVEELQSDSEYPMIIIGINLNCIKCKTERVSRKCYGFSSSNWRSFENPEFTESIECNVKEMEKFNKNQLCKKCEKWELLS